MVNGLPYLTGYDTGTTDVNVIKDTFAANPQRHIKQ